uniref:Tudor domain-containing protein 7 n=1 Tax=Knipowitschia caucasica TaxID=637954 RepID=A0AAV2LNA8_KNICA
MRSRAYAVHAVTATHSELTREQIICEVNFRMADSESIKKMLRSVLQSSKHGVCISSLQAEYRSLCGETIPLKRLGFSNLEDYLRSIPSVVRLDYRQGVIVCFAAVCKETAHIAELVARQKNSKKRSQVVNCRMRFKPSNLYSLNVKPKTSLRQPSNWNTQKRPPQGYGGFSASGDVRKLDPQYSAIPVQRRAPVPQPAQHNNVNNKEMGFQVNQRPPGISQTQKENIVQVHPNEFNLEMEQSKLIEILKEYNTGLWVSKLQDVYRQMFNQHPHPKTFQELEKWTHICALEKPSITNRADCLIYPSLPSLPNAVPQLFEDTFKMPLPEHALDDLSIWADICDVEWPYPKDKKKAILYYADRVMGTTEERAHPLPSGLEVVGSIGPPRLALPSEQYPSVLITDAKGSNAVTVRYVGKNYSNAQEAMEEAMRCFYGERLAGYSLSKVTIGQLVAVKEEDEEVARAQIMEVINPQKVKVYYLDYGCCIETSTQNLRELHQDFLSLPFQAINVKLAGLEHLSLHPLVVSTLEKLAVGKILLMETLEPCRPNEVPLVVLFDTSQEEDVNVNAGCLKALQDETMNNPLLTEVAYQNVRVTNVSSDGIIYCQLPSRGTARLSKLLEETEAFFKTQVTSESLVSKPFTGMLCLARYQEKWSRVEVISIYGNRVLEILLIDFGVTSTIEVTELREIPPPLLKDLLVIPPQAIKCILEDVNVPEGGWSLEAVKWVKELVLGGEATRMKICRVGHHNGNKLVYMHLFIGVDASGEDSINNQLSQSKLWQNLLTKHINNIKTATGLSELVEKLSLSSSAPFKNIPVIPVKATGLLNEKCNSPLSMPPIIDLPQSGQNMDVFVPVACHPGHFVLQPWQALHKLVVLMGEMVLYYNKTPKTSPQPEIKKGEIYAAKVDKNWHRVLVKGMLSNGFISIYELDHGKHELVRSTAIQPLIEEFRQLPFQAITAQLAGLSQLQWSEEAAMVFRNHIEQRALVAQVDSVQEAPDSRACPWERRLSVYLVDTTMEDRDLWIHTIMADLGGNHIWSKYAPCHPPGRPAINSAGGGLLDFCYLLSGGFQGVPPSIMSVMRKEMEKYRDVDEDELLKKLSEEELQRLEDELEELDPDNALLPAGLRQKDQTKKAPTGTFQRDNLLAHLEKQAKEHPDQEDLVPFTGEKRGKAWVPKKMVDPIMESVELEPELEEALASATDAELCDIAASPPPSLLHSPSCLL